MKRILIVAMVMVATAATADTNMVLTATEAALILERRLPWPERVVILKAREAAIRAANLARQTPEQKAQAEAEQRAAKVAALNAALARNADEAKKLAEQLATAEAVVIVTQPK